MGRHIRLDVSLPSGLRRGRRHPQGHALGYYMPPLRGSLSLIIRLRATDQRTRLEALRKRGRPLRMERTCNLRYELLLLGVDVLAFEFTVASGEAAAVDSNR
jgi:hypothetical protein